MTTTLVPRGAFRLSESLAFGFGQRDAAPDAEVMRLAFVLDGYQGHAGVAVRQDTSGAVQLEVTGTEDEAVGVAHAARVLSLDVDASGWDALGARDPLIGALQAARPGLRPPLFYSAYEAACWSVLSARRPQAQMAALRDRLARAHGAVVEVAGVPTPAFPTPGQLLAVAEFDGLNAVKMHRLHAIARAAMAGDLDTAALRELPPDEAAAQVMRLEGIGPFYATLITVRALGHTDVLPGEEPRLLAIAAELTGRPDPMTTAEFAALAEPWRPWRTWAGVAVRAAGPLLGHGPH